MINQLAVYSENKKSTYQEFLNDIQKYATWIESKPISKKNRYAVGLKNQYDHWVMLLALLNLGKECASIYNLNEVPEELRNTFDCCIVDDSKRLMDIEIQFDQQELIDFDKEYPLNEDNNEVYGIKIHDLARRLILTSGTTGRPKLVSLSAQQLRNHLYETERQLINQVNQDTRILHLMGIDTMGGFLMPLITWKNRGLVLMPSIADSKNSTIKLPLYQSNLLCASPARLKSLLEQFPGVWPGREQRQIRTAGSRLHITLRDSLIKNMGMSIQITYGSTELGGVSGCDSSTLDGDPSSVGKIFDNATVEIVDSKDNALANGQTGIIRCKTSSMVDQYSFGEKTLNFRDGWFYPGDIGKITGDGWLSISGRNSDVVNLGGYKVSAVDLESRLLKIKELDDVCVISFDISGFDELAVVIVHKDNSELQKIREQIDLIMTKQIKFHVVRVPVLTRNNMGKLLRNEMSNKLSLMLKSEYVKNGKVIT